MIAWHQGQFIEDRVTLHLAGGAFRCGLGVFETILAREGKPMRLERHVARMTASLDALGIAIAHGALEPVAVHCRILEVLRRNTLDTARVNIFCFQDEPAAAAEVLITAVPYALVPEATRRLTVYPHVQASYLSAYKTMANLHSRLAWEHAQRLGFDDAVLVGPDGMALETATAALLFSDGREYFTPATAFKLPSLALEAAVAVLPVSTREIPLAALGDFRHAYALNSLIGIQSVVQIDGVSYQEDRETCRAVTPAND